MAKTLLVTLRDSVIDREARGESVEEIAAAEGVSPSRVREILGDFRRCDDDEVDE